MSEIIADARTAELEIEGWAEHFEIDLDPGILKTLLPAVRRGRVTLDEETSAFSVKLAAPITLENGKTLADLKITEPTAGDLVGVKGDDFSIAVRLISKVSGQPIGVIHRLKQRDMIVLSGLVAFFS